MMSYWVHLLLTSPDLQAPDLHLRLCSESVDSSHKKSSSSLQHESVEGQRTGKVPSQRSAAESGCSQKKQTCVAQTGTKNMTPSS
jgi:hypothetical protein